MRAARRRGCGAGVPAMNGVVRFARGAAAPIPTRGAIRPDSRSAPANPRCERSEATTSTETLTAADHRASSALGPHGPQLALATLIALAGTLDGNRALQDVFTFSGDFVVSTRRSFLALSDAGIFPPRRHQLIVQQAVQSGIYGAARKAGRIHDVESVLRAGPHALEHGQQRRTQGHPRAHRTSIELSM